MTTLGKEVTGYEGLDEVQAWRKMQREGRRVRRRKLVKEPTAAECKAFQMLRDKGVVRLLVGDSARAEYTKKRLGDLLEGHDCRDMACIAVRENSVIMWSCYVYDSKRLTTKIEDAAYRDENTITFTVWSKKSLEEGAVRLDALSGRPSHYTTDISPEVEAIRERWINGEISADEYERLANEVSRGSVPSTVEDGKSALDAPSRKKLIAHCARRLLEGRITQEQYDELVKPYL